MCSGSVVHIHYCQGLLACFKLCAVIHQNAQNPLHLSREMTGIHYIVFTGKVFFCSLCGENLEVKIILQKQKAFQIRNVSRMCNEINRQ